MATKAQKLMLGAVAYDPKVVTIWDGFVEYFKKNGLEFDYILYTNYEQQVEAHFAGQIHIAWNSPLAWLQTDRFAKRQGRKACAIAMRDTDQDLTSVIVSRSEGTVKSLADLRGKVIGVGASDSPQATLIPLLHLAEAGIEPGKDCEVKRFDILVGKHGDHIGGEREAIKALLAKDVDAACIIDSNHLAFAKEGTIRSGSTQILATTNKYDHCNFTVMDHCPKDLEKRFRDLLFEMSYADSQVRPLLDLEGLKKWMEGRTSGYALLERAIDRFGTIEGFLSDLSKRFT